MKIEFHFFDFHHFNYHRAHAPVVGVDVFSFAFPFKLVKMFIFGEYRFPAHYVLSNSMYTNHNECHLKNFKVWHRNMVETSNGDVQVQHKNLRFHCLKVIRTHFSIYPLNLMEIFSQCYEFSNNQKQVEYRHF